MTPQCHKHKNRCKKLLDKSSIRIDIFLHSLSSMLDDNLPDFLMSTTSNMLALHYAIDKDLQKSEPDLHKYAHLCATRIKDFLREKVVLEEEFNSAVGLFAIALTPEMPETEDLPGMDKLRDQEQIIEVLGLLALGVDISSSELGLFSDAMDIALGDENSHEILNLIQSKPEVIKSMLKGKKANAKDVAKGMSDLAKSTAVTTSIISDFAQLAGLVACSALAFAANIMAVHSFESIAAAVIIPVTVATLNYGTKLGEKLGSKLAEFENDFKSAQKEVEAVLSDIVPTIQNSMGIVVQEVKREVVAGIDIKDIAKNLAVHIDTKSTEEQVAEIRKAFKDAGRSDDIERGM